MNSNAWLSERTASGNLTSDSDTAARREQGGALRPVESMSGHLRGAQARRESLVLTGVGRQSIATERHVLDAKTDRRAANDQANPMNRQADQSGTWTLPTAVR